MKNSQIENISMYGNNMNILQIFNSISMRFNTLLLKDEFKQWGVASYIASRPNSIIGLDRVSVGNNSKIGKNSVITYWGDRIDPESEIRIGNGTLLGDFIQITCVNKIEIGNNVLTGRFVTITDNSHGEFNIEQLLMNPLKRPIVSKGKVVIEDNVWIADKVTICPGVRVGKGSIIGANSVVTKDIPAYSMAVGSPARIIKKI